MTVALAPTATPATEKHHPVLGIAAITIGALLSTIDTRVTNVGLADIRGSLSLGFDEGSWLTTAYSAAQLVLCLSAAWLGIVMSPRRVLLSTASVFMVASVFPPLTSDPTALLVIQIVRGLAVGTFIPSTIAFIVRELPPRWWTWGIAAYAFRFVFFQNVSSSIEAFYDENGLWQWIFWQDVPATLLMIVLVWFGMRRQPIDMAALRAGDWTGIAFGGIGLAVLYTGLDQGNRLDWLNSGTIVGLLVAGGLLMLAFLVNELLVGRPLIDHKLLLHPNVLLPPLIITVYQFGVSATAFIVPDYLTRVQGFRSLQIADVVNWIALPQFVLVPLMAWTLRYLDARLLLAIGLATVAVASWMNTDLTHDWTGGDFLPALLVGAVGLALAVTSIVTFGISNIRPGWAITIAGMIQTGRLFGAELGSAFIQTYVRTHEQIASNLVGQQLKAGGFSADQRTALLSDVLGSRAGGADNSTGEAMLTLGNLVRREAYVLAYIDAFWLIAWVVTAGLLLLIFLEPPPPNHLTPPRLPPVA